MAGCVAGYEAGCVAVTRSTGSVITRMLLVKNVLLKSFFQFLKPYLQKGIISTRKEKLIMGLTFHITGRFEMRI